MSSHSHPAERRMRFPFYPVFLYAGLVSALVVADRLARWSGIDPVRLVAAFLIAIPICLAGARALDVAVNWPRYRGRPGQIFALANGGAAMYGALPALLLLSIPLARWLDIPFGTFWDAAFVSILAGMIPTRLGCLGAGCCAGRRTASWLGLRLRNARGTRAHRFPSQLFEALLGAVLLAAALVSWGELGFPGALALGICAAYGAGRLALEELREERDTRFAGLGTLQWISAALVVLGVGGLVVGGAGSHVPKALAVELATDMPGALHLLVSSLLLLPIVHLFRFVGCNQVFGLDDDVGLAVRQSVQLIVTVPDLGTGPTTVQMVFLKEPEMTEIPESPVDLALAGTEADTRIRFEAVGDFLEGSYTVNCTVSRSGAATRTGTCSGTLDAPDLAVAFNAAIGSPPDVLQPRLCFEPI